MLGLIEGCGIAVDHRPDGVVVGSFDPDGNLSLGRYFFATPEGLFLLILMLGLSYIFVHVALLCISPAIEAYRIRLELRLKQRAFEVYGARWLGIASPDDEAINGLRATLNISVSFVSKMMPRGRLPIRYSRAAVPPLFLVVRTSLQLVRLSRSRLPGA